MAEVAETDAGSEDGWATPCDVITDWQINSDCSNALKLSCTWFALTSVSPNGKEKITVNTAINNQDSRTQYPILL